MSRPFFSIGIPTYDRLAMVREGVQSCQAQTLGDFEATVANDYVPVPLTLEALGVAGDPRFRVINREKNLGPLENQNSLMRAAATEYFVWLSDDDMYMPELLQTAKDAIERSGKPDVVFVDFAYGLEYPAGIKQEPGEPAVLNGTEFLRGYFSGELTTQPWYGVWRTEFIQMLGGMKQMGQASFSPYSDIWLALRAASARKIVYLPMKLVFFRTHATARSTMSKDLLAYRSGQADVLESLDELLAAAGAADSKDEITALILLRFISDFFEVRRRGGVQLFELFAYARMIRRHLPSGPHRTRVEEALRRQLSEILLYVPRRIYHGMRGLLGARR